MPSPNPSPSPYSNRRERNLLNDLEDARHSVKIAKKIIHTWVMVIGGLSFFTVFGYEFLPNFDDYVWLPVLLLSATLFSTLIGGVAYGINLSEKNQSTPWIALRRAERRYNDFIMDQNPIG